VTTTDSVDGMVGSLTAVGEGSETAILCAEGTDSTDGISSLALPLSASEASEACEVAGDTDEGVTLAEELVESEAEAVEVAEAIRVSS
jgi:hypothetical protein